MTEPVATPPSSQTPPPAQPPTAPVAPSGDVPAAVSRPEWLPENHWDTTANTIKPEFGQHYAEVSTFHKTETERRAALAARKPEDIKFEVKLPDTVKVPDGMQFKIDETDPRVPFLREMALKRNWDQDAVDEFVTFDAQQKIAAHHADVEHMAAQDKALGPNGPARKQAIANFVKGMKDRGEYTQEEYSEIFSVSTSGPMVTAIEKLIAKINGNVPGAGGGQDPKPAEIPQEQRWYGATTPQKKVS